MHPIFQWEQPTLLKSFDSVELVYLLHGYYLVNIYLYLYSHKSLNVLLIQWPKRVIATYFWYVSIPETVKTLMYLKAFIFLGKTSPCCGTILWGWKCSSSQPNWPLLIFVFKDSWKVCFVFWETVLVCLT